MDWGARVGGAVLLGLVALVLQLLWRLLLGLLVFGPPSYDGVVVGHFVGVQFESARFGFLATLIVAGILGEVVCASLRAVRRAH